MKLLNHKFEGSTITYYFEDNIKLVVEDWGNGTKKWFQMGKLHRLDGPAVEWSDGSKEWWIKGYHYTEQTFNKKVKE